VELLDTFRVKEVSTPIERRDGVNLKDILAETREGRSLKALLLAH
jgi:hypothetical protein